MMLKLSLALGFFVNAAAIASWAQLDSEKLSRNPAWTKLLHNYQIRSPKFYAASSSVKPSSGTEGTEPSLGRSELRKLAANPEKVWEAHLQEFRINPNYSCRFPARAKFFSEALNETYTACPTVELWKSRISAQQISLVFVSQYVSNPASAFGHTFLLFRRQGSPLHLQTAISNSAIVPDEINDLDYIFRGLGGGFPAEFQIQPLFVKLFEYSQVEHRDIWIYDLNLSVELIDQVLNHVWELTHQADLPYYFLTQNCALHGYNALAAVVPDLQRLSPTLYLIPVETIAAVESMTVDRHYIPSLRENLAQKVEQLPPHLQREFRDSIQGLHLASTQSASPQAANSASAKSQNVAVAESVLEYFELLRSRQQGQLSPAQEDERTQWLIHRSQLPPASRTEADSPTRLPQAPHLALKPARVGLSTTLGQQRQSETLSIAPLSHRLLQPSAGYLPYSEIKVLDLSWTRLRTAWGSQDTLGITVAQGANYQSVTAFDSPLSWRGSFGAKNQVDCRGCILPEYELALGKSYVSFSQSRFFALAGILQTEEVPLTPSFSAGWIGMHRYFNSKVELQWIRGPTPQAVVAVPQIEASLPLGPTTSAELRFLWCETGHPRGSLGIDLHF